MDEFFGKLQTYLINKELSNSTISKIISQFRQFVVWCKKNRKTEYGDTSYRVSLPLNYKVVVTLKKEEISKLFEFNDFDYLKNNFPNDLQKKLKFELKKLEILTMKMKKEKTINSFKRPSPNKKELSKKRSQRQKTCWPKRSQA